MSDQLIGGPKPIAGDGLSQTGTMRALSPGGAGGNAGSPRGKALPPPAGTAVPEPVSNSVGRELRFIVDLDGNRPVIQVLDRETGKLIRQIPIDSVADDTSTGGAVRLPLLDTLA